MTVRVESKGRSHNNLDGVRLWAALLVVVSHQFALSGRWEPRVVGDHSFGNLGVLIFFSISGYLISASWERDPNVRRFVLRRVLRIIPGYLAVTIAAPLAVALFFPGPDILPKLYTCLKNIFLSGQDCPFFTTNPLHALNGSLWTLKIEIACYFIFLAVVLVCGRWTRALIAIGGLIALAAYVGIMHGQWGFDDAVRTGRLAFIPYFGSFFAVGVSVYYFPKAITSRYLIVFLAVGIAFLILGQTLLGLLSIVPLLALYIGLSSWPLLRAAGNNGDLSYGVYVWAWPMQQVVVRLLGPATPYLALLSLSVALIFFLAWVSWRFVEAPSLRHKPKAPFRQTNASTLQTIPTTTV